MRASSIQVKGQFHEQNVIVGVSGYSLAITFVLKWLINNKAGCAQRPVLRVNKSKTTGARITRARTRGQNPLVFNCLYIVSLLA
jgi:hypothetical protein